MDALLGSVTMKVSYPHVLPLEVIHEVSPLPLPYIFSANADHHRVRIFHTYSMRCLTDRFVP